MSSSMAFRAQRTSARPRPVSLLDGQDFTCALYGSLGFSSRFIIQATGLTTSQIAYRLRRGRIRRTDYRNGESPMAAVILRRTRNIAIPRVEEHLRRVIQKTAR